MFKEQRLYKIEVVSPSTDTNYDVPFSNMGVSTEAMAGAEAIVLRKNTGVGSDDDYEAVIDCANERLTIKEGTDGFSSGDLFIVAIYMPVGAVTGTSRSS